MWTGRERETERQRQGGGRGWEGDGSLVETLSLAEKSEPTRKHRRHSEETEPHAGGTASKASFNVLNISLHPTGTSLCFHLSLKDSPTLMDTWHSVVTRRLHRAIIHSSPLISSLMRLFNETDLGSPQGAMGRLLWHDKTVSVLCWPRLQRAARALGKRAARALGKRLALMAGVFRTE